MKVSESWLREWVNPNLDSNQLAEKLTMAGLEVDAITPVAGVFEGVIVAKVLETKPHPKADKLTLCQVSTGGERVLSIVCGASNVRPGLKVALATVGASLPGGLVIKEAQLRGELSEGMLCSESELGLSEGHEGILELDELAPLGQDFRTYLQLDDKVLDIDLTPNRADCLSVLGIAREVSALTNTPLEPLTIPTFAVQDKNEKNIHVEASDACPRYLGRIIANIDISLTSPVWLKEKLRRAGLRSINLVIDITNYVMILTGQPLHAFDLNQVNGDVFVRYAKADEEITLLDGRNLNLHEKDLVIADSKEILALAGVMGGESSAVHEETTAIFLESAYFNPTTIAATARRHGCLSDASQRFERGVDKDLAKKAMDYASALFIDLAKASVGPSYEQLSEDLLNPITLFFDPKKVKQLVGLDLPESQMIDYLQREGMQVKNLEKGYQISIPTYRFDLRLDVDLVEEIVRLYGYDKIVPEKLVGPLLKGSLDSIETLSLKIATVFSKRGYREGISYSFVDPSLQNLIYPESKALSLLNPISPELGSMRVGLWSGLIAAMIYNLHRQQTTIKLFETGIIFDNNQKSLEEYPCFAGLITGEHGSMNWSEATRPYDFYDLKGDLQALFAELKMGELRFVSGEHPALHPGKTAKVYLGEQDLGWCGILHPRLSDALDIQQDVGLIELRLDKILGSTKTTYRRISRFPQIRRDLSLLVDEQVSVDQIQVVVKEIASPQWLKSVDVFDLYRGGSIPKGKKSLAIAITLQDDERTLIDVEINTLIDAIIKALDERLAITLRDIS